MQTRTKAGLLAVLALVAVGIYSISCKPAWDPEGDKVAYIFGREILGESRYSVAIYDVTTKQNQVIVEEDSDADGPRIVPIEVFWPRRGNELVYVSAPEDEDEGGTIRVSTFDLRTNTTARLQEIAVPDVGLMSSMYPILLHRERWLWIPGDEAYFRVDLKQGTVTPLEHKETIFFGNSKNVFFVAEGSDDDIVFGKVKTLFGLKKVPLFTVRAQDDAEVFPVLAVPSRRTRLACIENHEETAMLRVFDGKGRCVKEIALSASVDWDDGYLGAEWNPDGTVLWMRVEEADDAETEYKGIAEIDITRGSVRIIEVNKNEQHGDLAPLHLSLSPNGAYLACSLFGDEQVGLCFVDLKTDERPVTFVEPLAEPAETK